LDQQVRPGGLDTPPGGPYPSGESEPASAGGAAPGHPMTPSLAQPPALALAAESGPRGDTYVRIPAPLSSPRSVVEQIRPADGGDETFHRTGRGRDPPWRIDGAHGASTTATSSGPAGPGSGPPSTMTALTGPLTTAPPPMAALGCRALQGPLTTNPPATTTGAQGTRTSANPSSKRGRFTARSARKSDPKWYIGYRWLRKRRK